MTRMVTMAAAKTAFTDLVREAAVAAAKGNKLISKDEEKALPTYLKLRSQELRQQGGKRTRVSVETLIEAAEKHADSVWSNFNPPGSRDARTLSREEVRAITHVDQGLGEMTFKAYERVRAGTPVEPPFKAIPIVNATLETTHPNASLVYAEGAYVLRSDTSGAVSNFEARHRGTFSFTHSSSNHSSSVHSLALDASPDGIMSASAIGTKMPEGFSFESVDIKREQDVLRHTFQIFADPPHSLRSDAAREIACGGLFAYIRDTRMFERDWQTCGLPNTWDGLLAVGIEEQCAAFGHFPNTEGDGQIERHMDFYRFVGRGPLGLYTEVEVSKVDGKINRVFVEID